jgi:curved DNA-binding protein CbpA
MALLHHPDKNPNDPTAADRVSEYFAQFLTS